MPEPTRAAPAWRRAPYRLLFPVGAALALVAVLPFPLRGAAGGGALAPFHSAAQVLGFLTCFVMGFLFTFVPRFTRRGGPDRWELGLALAVPPACTLSAWAGDMGTAVVLWLGLVAVAVAFTVRHLRAAPPGALRAAPGALIWILASLVAGATGAALTAAAPALSAGGAPAAWAIGRGLLVQGLVAGLVIGAVALLRAAGTAGDPRPARGPGWRAHALAAAAFFASFPLEVLASPRGGLALRAAVATGALVVAGLHRAGGFAGLQRRLVWLGAWLVPAGFWIGAAFPAHRGAALHVVFVGGFSLVSLALGAQAVEAGAAEPRPASPRALGVMAALLAAAFAARLAAAVDLARVAAWLAIAGAAFAAAVVAWAVAVARGIVRARPG